MNTFDVLDIWKTVVDKGVIRSSRNIETLDYCYFQGIIKNPWSTYVHRNYPVDYAKKEFLWYLRANRTDTSILKHAKMWEKLVQPDGKIFSNYGYYWFNKSYLNGLSGCDWVIQSITSDKNTRQAYIPMNNAEHLFIGNKDVVCSKGPMFRVIDDKLDINVSFRSSDAVYGIGTDLVMYWWLWELIAVKLNIPTGNFIFSADSIHIYMDKLDMVLDCINDPEFMDVNYPKITSYDDIIHMHFKSEFGKWLTS